MSFPVSSFVPSWISTDQLAARLGATAHLTTNCGWLLDVRRRSAVLADPVTIPGAAVCDPALAGHWLGRLASADDASPNDASPDVPSRDDAGPVDPNTVIVVFCVHGHEVSQGVAQLCARLGHRVHVLSGGLAGWQQAGHPTVPIPSEDETA
ncbi:MAG: rhodanese-like domain-containing protein [Pseudomonadota bacterium]